MQRLKILAAIGGLAIASLSVAAEGPVPTGVPRLEHVFVIMMENHGYRQIIGNPSMPFVNGYLKGANLAAHYYAVAHPSLTNYLEITGGSNFGILNDNSPDWHNGNCQSNLLANKVSNESVGTAICPIAGSGTDAATPAIDYSNETMGTPGMPATGDWNLDGAASIPAAQDISGESIADQLARSGLSWKSYQEDLPASGADGVNAADGLWSNLSDLKAVTVTGITPSVVGLYAAKHDPFVYFASIQSGTNPHSSLKNIVPFDTDNGLYADLATGRVPNYAFIAPNQCNDQHGRSSAGPFCQYDPNDVGTQVGLNPALMAQGDRALQNLVSAIHASPVWREAGSAIVVVWDENDYSVGIPNQVVTLVETNQGVHGRVSQNWYDHFSLLKSIEAAFHLPCLNHACDRSVAVMSDLFGEGPH